MTQGDFGTLIEVDSKLRLRPEKTQYTLQDYSFLDITAKKNKCLGIWEAGEGGGPWTQ